MTDFEIQVHKLKKGGFCFVARRIADGFRYEFKPFPSRVAAQSEGIKMLAILEAAKS